MRRDVTSVCVDVPAEYFLRARTAILGLSQEYLLPCLLEPATGSSPEPDESSVHLHTLIQDPY
jgi:hypothetical protein